jgi:hypothetical protein
LFVLLKHKRKSFKTHAFINAWANVLYANVLLNKMRCKLEPYKPNYVHLYPMSHFPWQSHVTHLPSKQKNKEKNQDVEIK